MTELKERFDLADRNGSPYVWAEAWRRAAAPPAPPRAIAWPPGAGRRLAAAGVALAVFATAAVFAWDVSHPDVVPSPPPSAADRTVNLGAGLPEGWSELPAPPEVRSGAATAWTGSQLLVWGGYEWVGTGDEDPDATGFAFDAASRRWTVLPASPLRGRADAAFAWTGRELLIWGGWDGGFRADPYFGDGAAFDPASRTWRMLPPAPIEARTAFSTWTGRELLVWGSTDRSTRRRDGAAYDPSTDTWRPIAEGPVDITDGSAVWTGEEMIVLGAALDGNNHADTPTAIAAAYDPEADAWRELPPSDLSPQAMTASWLGGELIAWDYDQASASYDPATDSWEALPRVPLAFSECRPVSIATSQIVFGEFCGGTVVFVPGEGAWQRDSMPAPEPEGGCCWVHEPVAAGDVVLVPSVLYDEPPDRTSASDRRMFAFNPREGGNQATGKVFEPEPFIPRSEIVAGEVRMPVVFPDGGRATLVFPPQLGLDELAFQPEVSYLWKEYPPPRFPILFLHDRAASIASYVEGAEPVGTVDPRIEIWKMSEEWSDLRQLHQGHWLAFRLPSWTVLVALERREQADAVAAHLAIRETEDGFPVAEASGPIELSHESGEGEGPMLAVGSVGSTAVLLSIERCTGGAKVDEVLGSGAYGSACLADGRISANVYGNPATVEAIVEGFRAEDFQPSS
jgi:hypothetical protein